MRSGRLNLGRWGLGRQRLAAFSGAILGSLAFLGLAGSAACRKADVPTLTPSVRLYLMSNVAGAMEPCGCRKDMLGGIDHAAALLATEDAPNASSRLLLAVGPLFFQEPELNAERREQDLWKAEALATSLSDLGLAAWTPGQNDLAAGPTVLSELVQKSGARVLGAGADIGAARAATTAVFEVGGYTVGVAGVGPGVGDTDAAARALAAAADVLAEAGAEIRVALLAAPRGEGLRLAERVPGFDVVALGRPVEAGDANDAPHPPTLVGETVVVQTPNHLQAVAYVDLFVKDGDFSFQDSVGIEGAERRQSLESRLADVESRLAHWSEEAAPATPQVAALKAELDRMRAELTRLGNAPPPLTQGSTFRYGEELVRESRGTDPKVTARMTEYYRRVNNYNKRAFADRKPAPPPFGSPSYVGMAQCSFCHGEATKFWRATQHAGAYATLSSEFKEYNLDCVSCHVTGYGRPGGSTVSHVGKLENVQCEACHGPGEQHAASGGDTSLITLKPAESVCKSCHHTPHVADDWDIETAWSRIIGEGHGLAAARRLVGIQIGPPEPSSSAVGSGNGGGAAVSGAGGAAVSGAGGAAVSGAGGAAASSAGAPSAPSP
jgi:hypothetical protein